MEKEQGKQWDTEVKGSPQHPYLHLVRKFHRSESSAFGVCEERVLVSGKGSLVMLFFLAFVVVILSSQYRGVRSIAQTASSCLSRKFFLLGSVFITNFCCSVRLYSPNTQTSGSEQ